MRNIMMNWLIILKINSLMLNMEFNQIHGFGFILVIGKLQLIRFHQISIGSKVKLMVNMLLM